jgi:hypothetical protein
VRSLILLAERNNESRDLDSYKCRRGNGARGLPCEIRQRQWVALAQALFHRARRTMLGDDGNLMQADGNSFPVFILGWTIGAIGVSILNAAAKP